MCIVCGSGSFKYSGDEEPRDTSSTFLKASNFFRDQFLVSLLSAFVFFFPPSLPPSRSPLFSSLSLSLSPNPSPSLPPSKCAASHIALPTGATHTSQLQLTHGMFGEYSTPVGNVSWNRLSNRFMKKNVHVYNYYVRVQK